MPERFDKDVESKPISDNDNYPVMPLRNTVLFPQQVIPIYIGREKSLKNVAIWTFFFFSRVKYQSQEL